MKKLIVKRLIGCVVLVLLIVGAAPSDAATPSSGTVTTKKRTISWTGSFALFNPAGGQTCEQDPMVPGCDRFSLKVVLGEGAKVEVKVAAANPSPQGGNPFIDGNDIDMYIYDPNGSLIWDQNNYESGIEKGQIVHKKKFNNKAYLVIVNAWTAVPATTYKGTAKMLTKGK